MKLRTIKILKWLGKKNQIKTNYIAQLIINQLLSDEIEKKKLTNAIVIDKKKKKRSSLSS